MLRSFLRTAPCIRAQSILPNTTPFALAWPLRASPILLLAGKHHIHTHRRADTRHHGFCASSSLAPSQPTKIVDPERPSLFYYLLPAPNPLSSSIPAYAVSFLEHPPEDAHSSAVLGWLPAAVSTSGDEEAGLTDFQENPKFMELVHKVLQRAVEDRSDARLNAEAAQRGEGWMHINDDRNVPTQGRISDPQDIIASVMVEDGDMLPETYSAMPAYRVCTSDGLTTLPGALQEKLVEESRKQGRTNPKNTPKSV